MTEKSTLYKKYFIVIFFIFASSLVTSLVYLGYAPGLSKFSYNSDSRLITTTAINSVQVIVEHYIRNEGNQYKLRVVDWNYIKNLLRISVILITFLLAATLRLLLIKQKHKIWDATLLGLSIIIPVITVLTIETLSHICCL